MIIKNTKNFFLWTSQSLRGALFVFVALATIPFEVNSQEPDDSLRADVERLANLVDSLSSEVARLIQIGEEEKVQDALAKLRAAATAAAGDQPRDTTEVQELAGRQRSLQALNPEISLNADIFGQINKDDKDGDNFFAREFEISIISNLDPLSRAAIFLSRHNPGGEISPFGEEEHDEHGGGFALEEGYVEWVGLVGGLSLKLGKFFQQFGQINRWHAHALPFQTRSLPHLAFIGEESLAQTGASIHWLAPFGGDAGVYEATLEVTSSENEELFGESNRLSVLGHLNAFWNLSASTDLDLGLSWINGSYKDEKFSFARNLYGAEMALTWRPPGRSKYRGFTFRGGVMVLDGLVPTDWGPVPATEAQALGFWGAAEARLSQSWLVGVRADLTESPEKPSENAWLFAPTLTWWQSEYVRLRIEYDLVGRSFQSSREGRLLFQTTFAMGPHKHATY
jgi:hypothetical protein